MVIENVGLPDGTVRDFASVSELEDYIAACGAETWRKGVKMNFISKWLDLHAWQICAFCFLVTGGQLERYGHWYVYLPIQFIGFLMMGQYAKRYHARKRIQEVGDPCLIR